MSESMDMYVTPTNTSYGGGGASDNASYWLVSDVAAAPTTAANAPASWRGPLSGEVRIPLYSIIFFLAVVGNSLVIITLTQNRRMRTVTNVFLMNLSVSDLLLAVFCMPFTLIPTLLQDFIFGRAMCILIRYMQAMSVGVSVFTLVAISLERYFAICQPLRSRSWQTLSHSYRIIAVVWLISLVIMIPIAVFQQLRFLPRTGTHKCLEIWTSPTAEKSYTIFLDMVLLVIPLFLMLMAYGKISLTLWRGMQLEMRSVQELTELRTPGRYDEDVDTDDETRYDNGTVTNGRRSAAGGTNGLNNTPKKRCLDLRQHMRQSNTEKSLQAKKRVIKMLSVVVLEFFVCWTPTYIMQTWYICDYMSAKASVSPMAMNFIHLMSYVSSCCNPITYCFMNKKFRQGFLSAFQCCPCAKRRIMVQNPGEHSYMASQRTGNLKGSVLKRFVWKNTSEMVATCGYDLRPAIAHCEQGSPSAETS